MAFFKCKMCGGDLEIAAGTSVHECEYCGTKQTVPTSKDENLQSVYNRANTLRIKSEFDKAEKLYEKIVQTDETQAEAYWGMILCRNGIEYVEDPVTLKRIPTCHRASFESIIADEDYKSAIKYADFMQKSIYEAEAKVIDNIQKGIVALSQKEKPYDVFICYKETDVDGKRTQDSVIANEIYHQLIQEGFNVFYSAITLEEKLGHEYEPYIFAALNSAKVMLVVGTKPEYFKSVWVKNEWSRYLKIIKKDRNKLLIPCYKDMDAYDLPEEFSHLQAQDMSKIGFINDVVRGIKKVIKTDDFDPVTIKEVVATSNANATPLLKRMFIFLEDGEFDFANEYAEKVLDIDPECAEAYLGKLMVNLQVTSRIDLAKQETDFTANPNYNKVIRYGENAIIEEMQQYVESVKENMALIQKDVLYNSATSRMSSYDIDTLNQAIKCFESLDGWKDSEQKIVLCQELIQEIEINKQLKVRQFQLKQEIDSKKAKSYNIILATVTLGIQLVLLFISVIMRVGNYSLHLLIVGQIIVSLLFNGFSIVLPFVVTVLAHKSRPGKLYKFTLFSCIFGCFWLFIGGISVIFGGGSFGLSYVCWGLLHFITIIMLSKIKWHY